jgi:hypothetical protein
MSLAILCGKIGALSKKPLDHLILNGFHISSEYFEAGNDHFALFGLEFQQ